MIAQDDRLRNACINLLPPFFWPILIQTMHWVPHARPGQKDSFRTLPSKQIQALHPHQQTTGSHVARPWPIFVYSNTNGDRLSYALNPRAARIHQNWLLRRRQQRCSEHPSLPSFFVHGCHIFVELPMVGGAISSK